MKIDDITAKDLGHAYWREIERRVAYKRASARDIEIWCSMMEIRCREEFNEFFYGNSMLSEIVRRPLGERIKSLLSFGRPYYGNK